MKAEIQYSRGGHFNIIHRMVAALGVAWKKTTLLELIEVHGLKPEWQQAIGFHE